MGSSKTRAPAGEPGTRRGSPAELTAGKAAAQLLEVRVTWWILIPFFLATVAALATRFERAQHAMRDIDEVAKIVAAKAEARHPLRCEVRGEDIQGIVAEAVREQYSDRSDRQDEGRYRVLVQTVSNDLQRLGGEPAAQASGSPCHAALGALRGWVRRDIHLNLGFFALAEVVLIFMFPALFIAGYARARREIVARAAAGGPYRSHADEIACRRNARLLGQLPLFFWRRLSFALLIAFGADYLFAPLGLRASTLGDYTMLHPILGTKTYPFWAEQAQNASPVAAGFFGYLLYAVTLFFDRFVKRDLDDRIFMSLLTRGISVLLLSLVLTGVTDGGDLARALIFLVGVFPKTGLDALSKIARVSVEKITTDDSAGFEVLSELNLSKQATLRELGISDVYDLAQADLRELVVQVGMSPGVLLRAADRALLIHTFGVEGAKKLEAIPAYTATELVLYGRGVPCDQVDIGGSGSPDGALRPKPPPGSGAEDGPFLPERKERVGAALCATDVTLQLDSLARDPNVLFLLEQRCLYGHY